MLLDAIVHLVTALSAAISRMTKLSVGLVVPVFGGKCICIKNDISYTSPGVHLATTAVKPGNIIKVAPL